MIPIEVPELGPVVGTGVSEPGMTGNDTARIRPAVGMLNQRSPDGCLKQSLARKLNGFGFRVVFRRTARNPLKLPASIASQSRKKFGPQRFDRRALIAGFARPHPKELKLIRQDAVGGAPNTVSDSDFEQTLPEQLMKRSLSPTARNSAQRNRPKHGGEASK